VRTTAQEKERFQLNAEKCGLSLSEYLRKLANGYLPKEVPPVEYAELVQLLTEIYNDFRDTGEKEYARFIVGVLSEFMAAFKFEKRGDVNGNDKNLGSPG